MSIASSSCQLRNSLTNLSSLISCRFATRWHNQPQRNLVSESFKSNEEVSKFWPSSDSAAEQREIAQYTPEKSSLVLDREQAKPVLVTPRLRTPVYRSIMGPKGVQLASFDLMCASLDRAQCSWVIYTRFTPGERLIYARHLDAVKYRLFIYRDPYTKQSVFTVNQLLLNGECCGSGCRHCPYGLKNCSKETRDRRAWNGHFWV